jgi:hypothetical protein
MPLPAPVTIARLPARRPIYARTIRARGATCGSPFTVTRIFTGPPAATRNL